jgi:uncharacterized delta-60 repeat protein
MKLGTSGSMVVVCWLLLGACGQGDDDGPGDEGGDGELALTLGASPAQLRAGVATAVEVRVERAAGFAAEVEVSVEGLPAGAQASPIAIGPDDDRGVVEIETAADAPLETTSLVAVVGRAGGQEARVEFETMVVGASGSLDVTFGEGGVAPVPVAADGTPSGFLVEADGSILLATSVEDGILALSRYLADGTVDGDYGADGVAFVPPEAFGATFVETVSLAQQSGRVVIAGHDYTDGGSASDLYLARLTDRGELDLEFAGGGAAAFPLGERDTFGGSNHLLAIDDQDRILAGGTHRFNDGDFETDPMVVRFTPDGELDDSFGNGGVAVFELADQQSATVVVAVADRVMLFGDTSGRPFAIQLDQAGDPVADFGDDGYLLLPAPAGGAGSVTSAALAADGSLLLTGDTSGGAPALWRMTAAGEPDAAWGDGGVLVHPVSEVDDGIYSALAPLDGGGLLAAGSVRTPTPARDSLLVAAAADGAVDAGFGAAGRAEHDLFAESDEEIVALAARPALRCLALLRLGGGGQAALVRFWR